MLREITSKHHDGFCCLNYFCSFAAENKFESHEKVFENNVFVPLQCLVKTLLEFNHYQKSDKAPFIIYTDLRCLIGKINGCKNAPVKLSSKKVYEHSTSDFSVSTISPFKSKESKNNVYKGKD